MTALAQLRDATTGELIAEGTPTEVALLAAQVPDVLLDSVGVAFDPVAERDRHTARVRDATKYAATVPPAEKPVADKLVSDLAAAVPAAGRLAEIRDAQRDARTRATPAQPPPPGSRRNP